MTLLPSHQSRDPRAVLKTCEKKKKDKYGDACRQAHRHFTPLVYSIDGLEGGEAKAARRQLATKLSAKWNRQYSQVCGLVRARIALALARATSNCLRGTRDHRLKTSNSLEWISNSGVRVFAF